MRTASVVAVVLFVSLLLTSCGSKPAPSSPPPRTESTKVKLELKDGSRVEGLLVHRDGTNYYVEVAGKRIEIARSDVANAEGLERPTRSTTGGSSTTTAGSSGGNSSTVSPSTGSTTGGGSRVETDPVTGNPRVVVEPSLNPSLPNVHIPTPRIEKPRPAPNVQPRVTVQPQVKAVQPANSKESK